MKGPAMRRADWYFDYISPYAYLQFKRLNELPEDIDLRLRPVLFAGLLNHWGQLGPAEIPAKKRHTFLLCRWRARAAGHAFKPPPRHPFNPLTALRLTLTLGCSAHAVGAIFDHIWAEGQDGEAPASMQDLAGKLDVPDLEAAIGAPDVKAALRTNTEEAAAKGVYGVPSFAIEDEIFWGDDMFDLMRAWLADPSVLTSDEAKRIADLPAASERRR